MKNMLIGMIYAAAITVANPSLNIWMARWWVAMLMICLSKQLIETIANSAFKSAKDPK